MKKTKRTTEQKSNKKITGQQTIYEQSDQKRTKGQENKKNKQKLFHFHSGLRLQSIFDWIRIQLIRILKPDPDPADQNLKNRIRIHLIRISNPDSELIRILKPDPDPTLGRYRPYFSSSCTYINCFSNQIF